MTLRPRFRVALLTGLTLTLSGTALAGVPKDLPYPGGEPSAAEIADQVYYVNHFYAVDNYSIEKDGNTITALIKRGEGESPTTDTLERYLNNTYDDGVIKAKDLAIFRSGKLRGTGMLITDFVDDDKSQSYVIWLPALRKIRRFAQPAHDDAWGGSDFTFGDVTLRKPMHETHELLGRETFDACLGAMEIAPDDRNRYMGDLPGPDCSAKGKEVYKLKSTTKFENWWYDYRISYVDAETFADYHTEYFKDGKKIKVLDRAWGTMGLDDPRAQTWRYWYGKNLETGHETWAVIPPEVNRWNSNLKDRLWTERTLRRIRR
jgi:hypothetical protein